MQTARIRPSRRLYALAAVLFLGGLTLVTLTGAAAIVILIVVILKRSKAHKAILPTAVTAGPPSL